MLTLSYTITEPEFQDYYYYMCWAKPEKKTRRWLYYIVLPIAISVFLYGLWGGFDKDKPSTNSLLIAAAAAIGLFFLVPYWMKTAIRSNAKKALTKSGPDTILTHYELMISEQGIAGKTKVAEVKYSWAAFKKKVVVNNSYYLYLNINQALVIPLRAFTTEQEKKDFESLLAQNLPLNAEYPFQQ